MGVTPRLKAEGTVVSLLGPGSKADTMMVVAMMDMAARVLS